MRLRYCIYLFTIIALFALGSCSSIIAFDDDVEVSGEITTLPAEIADSSSLYYYYYGEPVYLTEVPDLVFLKFKDIDSRNLFISKITPLSLAQIWASDKMPEQTKISSDILILQSLTGSFPSDLIDEFCELDDIEWFSTMTSYSDQLLAVTNEFSVKLKNMSDYQKLVDLAGIHDCDVYHKDFFDAEEFFVKVPKRSEFGAIQLASLFFETGQFEYTSPDFFILNPYFSSDPYFSSQWGLKNTGQYGSPGVDINIEPAWNITEGSSDVVVAIIDTGVESTHPDLSSNLLTGYNAFNYGSGGDPIDASAHGTMVAGIVGAIKDNSIGISGVAPGCKLLPVCMGNSYGVSSSAAVAGINWARQNNADVMNCSWGDVPVLQCVTDAIYNAATLGRGGKGCVMVFATGQDGYSYIPYPSYLTNVISVGAVTPNGLRHNNSDYGNGLDVVAPGMDIKSTIRQGLYGDDSGTSYAAPHVSGIAALILSEYPDLTEAQVRRAIELSCTKPSGYSYSYDDQYPSALWNNHVGYGVANAYYALLKASDFHEQNVLDGTPGFDFVITNHSSYPLEDFYISLTGKIGGVETTLIAADPGDAGCGMHIGYPVYRGETITAVPGTSITNLSLNISAISPDDDYYFHIGAAIDNPYPIYYYDFAFGYGNMYQCSIPNTTVPNSSRRILYIDIL
ncbi:MAG: S8 family serine peptidase [Bacteroidales bacterium]|nr:S8 family serine peptidase [Bacteroidales bacterium]